MSQAPRIVAPKQTEPLYRVVSGYQAEIESELNYFAARGYRVVGIIPAYSDFAPKVILELCETISLTKQGDQAISENLSV